VEPFTHDRELALEEIQADPVLTGALAAWKDGDDRAYTRSVIGAHLGGIDTWDGLNHLVTAAEEAEAGGLAEEYRELVEALPTLKRLT